MHVLWFLRSQDNFQKHLKKNTTFVWELSSSYQAPLPTKPILPVHPPLKDVFIFIFCVRVFCWHVCLCTMCICSVHRGQKRARDPLELEF